MAVVNINGSLYMTKVKTAGEMADHRYSGGKTHASIDKATIAIGDEALSTYALARVNKLAVLLPESVVVNNGAAITGTISVGSAAKPTGLASAIDPATGVATPLIAAAKLGMPLWQALGFTTEAEAPSMIDLIVTLNTTTQATAATEIQLRLLYTLD